MQPVSIHTMIKVRKVFDDFLGEVNCCCHYGLIGLVFDCVAEVKPATFMENIVTIYRNLEATFNANVVRPVSSSKL